MKIYDFFAGDLPILISMPHNGSDISSDISEQMHPYALKSQDTDWNLDTLYDFASDIGCNILKPRFSRYVIDLNRSTSDESLYPGADVTGLCPVNQFDYRPIYLTGKEPDNEEIARRIEIFWRPYHEKLSATLKALTSQFGYALLFEAHSIKSEVPRFFEGRLPDFSFGNFDQKSSSPELSELIKKWQPEGYCKVFNQRFKGGYITRHYGRPAQNIDSMQLELSQATYMDEVSLQYDSTKADKVKVQLRYLIESFAEFTRERIKSV